VLAPVIFNIYLAAVTLRSHSVINPADGITYCHRPDGNFLNLRRCSRRHLTRTEHITLLQYDDDAALPSHSAAGLQRLITASADSVVKCGLVVNPQKTKVLHQLSSCTYSSPISHFHVGEEDIGSVEQFMYLGTILSSWSLLDDDIDNRIRLALSAFGRLQSRVFLNRDLSTSTKVDVYKAVFISTLLFGSEA